ncbi:MAG: JAB domain-containing protein [Labilithrix sp.]|nr:JAB domain-containing protein [Labilithrix sp.]
MRRFVEEADVTGRSVGELLAMVIRAREPMLELLDRAGGIEGLARADAFEIAAHLEGRDLDALDRRRASRPGRAAMDRARSVAAAFELGRRLERARAHPPDKLTSAVAVAAWAQPRIGALAHEELWMLALDGRGHLRAARCVARGGLHGAAVRAADPIRAALRADASAFVLVHNHPSGDPTPSREDAVLTADVAAAAHIAGVPLLDHVVVARGGFACVPTLPPAAEAARADAGEAARSDLAAPAPSSAMARATLAR